MRLETQTKVERTLQAQFQHVYGKAKEETLRQDQIIALCTPIREQIAASGLPNYKMYALEQYRQALHDEITRNHIMYGHFIKGVFYSVDSSRDDYYGLTFTMDEFREINSKGGQYWKYTKKPFFEA